jgi:hypothetical protein
MKNMSKKKLKTSEPFGSALWPDLLRYRTFAVVFTTAACPMPCISSHRALATFKYIESKVFYKEIISNKGIFPKLDFNGYTILYKVSLVVAKGWYFSSRFYFLFLFLRNYP